MFLLVTWGKGNKNYTLKKATPTILPSNHWCKLIGDLRTQNLSSCGVMLPSLSIHHHKNFYAPKIHGNLVRFWKFFIICPIFMKVYIYIVSFLTKIQHLLTIRTRRIFLYSLKAKVKPFRIARISPWILILSKITMLSQDPHTNTILALDQQSQLPYWH